MFSFFWNLWDLRSRCARVAPLRRCRAPLALLFESFSAPPAAGSAVRLRTTVAWATVAMSLFDDYLNGSDDDIHPWDSASEFEGEDEHGEDFHERGRPRSSLHADAAPAAADGCASSAAQRPGSEPQEVSPHAHRGAERLPRHRSRSKDSRSPRVREIEWVKDGVQEDLINQDFECSLHHSEVQREWSSFIQSAVNASKETQSAPVVNPLSKLFRTW
jgi:hypothetical protein